jgi:tRNA modification GTPase
MNTVDTICAICTGTGGAISIIRISGPGALNTGAAVWRGRQALGLATARQMLLGKCCGDPALAVYMPAPHSYTGDDIVEIHCHGGALTARRVLNAALGAGARPAEPGEFTFRAFINEKLDLVQAEAVSDIIGAHSQMALNLAQRQIAGRLSAQISALRDELVQLLAETESRLDFGDEHLDWQPPEEICARLGAVLERAAGLIATFAAGLILREGIRVVLAGRPNAGKSSLLNLLLGQDRAIVSRIPGTTRDTIEESTHLRNIPVRLTDTAGIRSADDHVERLGIDRSRSTIESAQVVIWLLDATSPCPEEEIREMNAACRNPARVIAAWNKIDQAGEHPLPELSLPTARISATENLGIDGLLDLFEQMVWGHEHAEEPEVAVNARHHALLQEAANALAEAIPCTAAEQWELAAAAMRQAITALGAITGETVDPDILENIFAKFCIGK